MTTWPRTATPRFSSRHCAAWPAAAPRPARTDRGAGNRSLCCTRRLPASEISDSKSASADTATCAPERRMNSRTALTSETRRAGFRILGGRWQFIERTWQEAVMKSKSLWKAVVIALGLVGAVSINVYAGAGRTVAARQRGDGGRRPVRRPVRHRARRQRGAGVEDQDPDWSDLHLPATPRRWLRLSAAELRQAGFRPRTGRRMRRAGRFRQFPAGSQVREGERRPGHPPAVIDKSYAEALKTINLADALCGDSRAISWTRRAGITMRIVRQRCTGTSAGMPSNAPRRAGGRPSRLHAGRRSMRRSRTWDETGYNPGGDDERTSSIGLGETVGEEEGVRDIIVTTELSA